MEIEHMPPDFFEFKNVGLGLQIGIEENKVCKLIADNGFN